MFKRSLKATWKGCTQCRRAMAKITTYLIGNSRDLVGPCALAFAAKWLQQRSEDNEQYLAITVLKRWQARASRPTQGLLLAFPLAPSQPSFSCLHSSPRSYPHDHWNPTFLSSLLSHLFHSSSSFRSGLKNPLSGHFGLFHHCSANLLPIFPRKLVISLSLLLHETMKGNQNVRTRTIGSISSNWHTWKMSKR